MKQLKQSLAVCGVVLCTAFTQTPAFANTTPKTGPAGKPTTGQACTHSGGTLNLRLGAGQNFQKVANIPHGADLAVLDSVGAKDGFTWYKVRFGKKVGFVRSDYVCGL